MLFLAALHATFFASTQVKAQKRERGIFLIVQLLQVKRSYFWSDSCRIAPYVHHYDTLEKQAMTLFQRTRRLNSDKRGEGFLLSPLGGSV